MSKPTLDDHDDALVVGSLRYTNKTLFQLFCWLIWGDICFMLMENVIPSILPLYFQKLHASNETIATIMTTIPMSITAVVNPIVSFRSDRHRSKWGRRIPFIVYTAPFLVMAMIALGFYDSIARWAFGLLAPHFHLTEQLVAITAIGFFYIAFTYFNCFVGAVFWYLFNDVVPEHLLARFMSLFRVFSMLTAMVYNICIFRYAGQHSTVILVGCGMVYLFGFGLMCMKVKEGEYPPAPHYTGGKVGPIAAVQTFFTECLSIPHYWYVFLATIFIALANSINNFQFFYYESTLHTTKLATTTALVGDIAGCSNIGIMLLIPFSGWLADRYHPIRIVLCGFVVNIFITLPCLMAFMVWHPATSAAYWYWVVYQLVFAGVAQALLGVFDPPMFMVVFPRSRYGQYCSANAMLRAIAGIFGGLLAGGFLDYMNHKHIFSLGHGAHFILAWSFMNAKDVYRLIPVWQFAFMIPAFICTLLLYKSWLHYGGDQHYHPPVPGETLDEYARTEMIELDEPSPDGAAVSA